MLGVFKSYVGHINSTLEMSTAVHSQDELVCPNHLTDWLTEELCWLDATNGFQSIEGWWKLVSDAWRMWVRNFARKRIITTFKHWQAWRFVLHSHSTSSSWELPVQLIERLNLTSWTWPKSKVGRLKRLKRHFFAKKKTFMSSTARLLTNAPFLSNSFPSLSKLIANSTLEWWAKTTIIGHKASFLQRPICAEICFQREILRQKSNDQSILYILEGVSRKNKQK